MLDWTDTNESRQDFRIQGFLHVDEQVCGQLQSNPWHRQEQQQSLFESRVALDQAADFLVNCLDGLAICSTMFW